MTKGIRELNLGEMAKVSGGGTNDIIDDSSHDVTTSTTKPHCRSCWREVTLINGSFMCDHIGCSELGVPKKATEVAWY